MFAIVSNALLSAILGSISWHSARRWVDCEVCPGCAGDVFFFWGTSWINVWIPVLRMTCGCPLDRIILSDGESFQSASFQSRWPCRSGSRRLVLPVWRECEGICDIMRPAILICPTKYMFFNILSYLSYGWILDQSNSVSKHAQKKHVTTWWTNITTKHPANLSFCSIAFLPSSTTGNVQTMKEPVAFV